jgi:hypothetical protein
MPSPLCTLSSVSLSHRETKCPIPTNSRASRSSWTVAQIAADPRARLRVGAKLYERKAVRVQDADELALVRKLNQEKYGTDPVGWEEPPWVYRLDPR